MAFYSYVNGTNVRWLGKYFGLLFEIETVARAGKFDIKTTVLKIGSGVALLSLVSKCDLWRCECCVFHSLLIFFSYF